MIGGKHWLAHRVSFYLSKGFSGGKLDVCHSCDNKLCGNPDHLSEGTRSENLIQCVIKGRHKSGKLNPEKVLEIRDLSAEHKISNYELARRYGVVPSVIWAVVNNKTWKTVKNQKDMQNTQLPAYPEQVVIHPQTNEVFTASQANSSAGGFTKLELASLMIAQGRLGLGDLLDRSEKDFAAECVDLAKTILEEANK